MQVSSETKFKFKDSDITLTVTPKNFYLSTWHINWENKKEVNAFIVDMLKVVDLIQEQVKNDK